ncbi:bifunctional metallophosphatase/5'-nucleotidase [Methyloterricola oryzae]|uniref:bifunctional metallophosphatase/5'-nucleotidase n=1 Tax=Methyloterricola oryzae TaxID=1495050 RepID=UPI001300F07E|nr:bifunctional metallophosphatase/5'-nucleotidase [Methyloterricola oryzae]
MGLFACAAPIRQAPGENSGVRHLRILQVNDTYKVEGLENGTVGGFARLRSLRRQLESDGGGPVLLLHAGDFLYPSVMSKYLAAEPMVRVMNLLDGDGDAFDPNMVVTFGNHEFDNPDPGILLGRIAQSDFAWISSNVRYRPSQGAPLQDWDRRVPVPHHLLRDVNGVRIGLFALTLNSTEQDYVGYRYTEDERCHLVRTVISALQREGAEVIVALTHQDLEQDQWLAREFPEIDLIAGGHEHFHIQERVGKTWITKADADNLSAIIHHVTLKTGQPPAVTPHRVVLDTTIPQDRLVQAEVDRSLERLATAIKKTTGRDGATVVASTIHPLEGLEAAVRRRETALGNFLADTLRARMRTDVALLNAGGIRINDNIPPGPVTAADLEGLYYFDDTVVSFQITGVELLDLLRHSIAKAHLGYGGFLQVSGIRFRYRISGPAENPLTHIDPSDVWVQRFGDARLEPLDLKRRYSAAATDFLWNRGFADGYPLFRQGAGGSSPPRLDHGSPPSFRSVIEEALALLTYRTITTRIDGRIKAEIMPP